MPTVRRQRNRFIHARRADVLRGPVTKLCDLGCRVTLEEHLVMFVFEQIRIGWGTGRLRTGPARTRAYRNAAPVGLRSSVCGHEKCDHRAFGRPLEHLRRAGALALRAGAERGEDATIAQAARPPRRGLGGPYLGVGGQVGEEGDSLAVR